MASGCIQVRQLPDDAVAYLDLCLCAHRVMPAGANGMWIIGGQDAKDKNFKCSHGFIFCRTQNSGVRALRFRKDLVPVWQSSALSTDVS